VRSLVAPLIVAVPAPLLVTVLFLVGSWLPLLAWVWRLRYVGCELYI